MPQPADHHLQSTSAQFAESIGRAVLAWQAIESACGALFVNLLDARNAEGALVAFHAVHSANVRAVMLKSAAHAMFQNPDFADLDDEFDHLMDRLGEASRLRNRLSHSEVHEHLTPEGWTFTLAAPAHEAETAGFVKAGIKARTKTAAPLSFETIKGAEDQFHGLAHALTAFAGSIAERLEQV